jgi:hypothetical protein
MMTVTHEETLPMALELCGKTVAQLGRPKEKAPPKRGESQMNEKNTTGGILHDPRPAPRVPASRQRSPRVCFI